MVGRVMGMFFSRYLSQLGLRLFPIKGSGNKVVKVGRAAHGRHLFGSQRDPPTRHRGIAWLAMVQKPGIARCV